MKKFYKILLPMLMMVCLIAISSDLFAQVAPFPGGASTSTPPCWPPPCVPIDGGVSLVVILGALFGGKKIYDATK